MAVRRMFSRNILHSDQYMTLPPITRELYILLCMEADDDGFVNNAQTVIRFAGSDEEDLRRLIERGLLIPFDNGVAAITHWRVHNQIRKDRYVPTRYQEQFTRLTLRPDGAYALPSDPAESPPSGPGIPNGNPV